MTRIDQSTGKLLPKQWPTRIRSAIVHAISLARTALIVAHAQAGVRRNSRVRLRVENERLRQEVALLQEELRIKDARMVRVPASRRPHYLPIERLEILELRAARGWSLAQTGRRHLVTTATVASWMHRLDEHGRSAIVQVRKPVNRFPDLVHHLVRRLKRLCPSLGTAKIAQLLCRAGLHLSTSTVRRILRRRTPLEPDRKPAVRLEPVSSSRPNHVWLADLTAVPTSAGLWLSWSRLPLPQRWPFCWWVAVIVDHYSRRIMELAVFPHHPNAQAVRASIARAVRAARSHPRYLLTDQGTEFRERGFRRFCRRRGIRQRFGAAGRHGSTAVVERLNRTIKDECTRRVLVSFSHRLLSRELSLYSRWYNEQRPHDGLRTATPAEIYRDLAPASMRPRFEPRSNWPRGAPCAAPNAPVRGRCGVRLEMRVRFLAGRRHLPLVSLRRVA